jgi:hypothetical protein
MRAALSTYLLTCTRRRPGLGAIWMKARALKNSTSPPHLPTTFRYRIAHDASANRRRRRRAATRVVAGGGRAGTFQQCRYECGERHFLQWAENCDDKKMHFQADKMKVNANDYSNLCLCLWIICLYSVRARCVSKSVVFKFVLLRNFKLALNFYTVHFMCHFVCHIMWVSCLCERWIHSNWFQL